MLERDDAAADELELEDAANEDAAGVCAAGAFVAGAAAAGLTFAGTVLRRLNGDAMLSAAGALEKNLEMLCTQTSTEREQRSISRRVRAQHRQSTPLAQFRAHHCAKTTDRAALYLLAVFLRGVQFALLRRFATTF